MTAAPATARERLVWLDIARVLCALMILGIHWLRACYNVRLFGAGGHPNLVVDYQGHSGGLLLFHYVLIAGTSLSLSAWLSNLIGLLGGFGWEAVSALILISGFSLALAQRGKRLSLPGWVDWYKKRAKRILIPYYLVALPLLAIYGLAILVLQRQSGHMAQILDLKLLSQFPSPLLGTLLSHLLLFNPWGVQWAPTFSTPAWWFVPAILLAYLFYPSIRAASRFGRGLPLLFGAAAVTIISYELSDARILINETWYYIVLQESFNFCLGVVIANAWMGEGRRVLERIIADPRCFALGIAVFVLGNIFNWMPSLRPVASMLYGPSLVVIVAYLGKRIEATAAGRALLACDSYDLYLVHQPFAFPIALISKGIFHAYGIFVGWFIFVAVAVAAMNLLSRVQHFRVLPSRTLTHTVAQPPSKKRRDATATR
jgi:hypothetical protein